MGEERKPAEFQAPLMSAFREAFQARDATKRAARSVEGERVILHPSDRIAAGTAVDARE